MIKLNMTSSTTFEGVFIVYRPAYSEVSFKIEKVSSLWHVAINGFHESAMTTLDDAMAYLYAYFVVV